MKLRIPSLFLLVGTLSMLLVMPATSFAQAAPQGQGQGGGRNQAPGQNRTTDTNFPITAQGTVNNGAPANFTGTYKIAKFQVTNGCLEAVGHLVLNGPGLSPALDQDDVTMPVQSINGKSVCGKTDQGDQTDQAGADDLTIAQVPPTPACNILNLVLGPLHLNVLASWST